MHSCAAPYNCDYRGMLINLLLCWCVYMLFLNACVCMHTYIYVHESMQIAASICLAYLHCFYFVNLLLFLLFYYKAFATFVPLWLSASRWYYFFILLSLATINVVVVAFLVSAMHQWLLERRCIRWHVDLFVGFVRLAQFLWCRPPS